MSEWLLLNANSAIFQLYHWWMNEIWKNSLAITLGGVEHTKHKTVLNLILYRLGSQAGIRREAYHIHQRFFMTNIYIVLINLVDMKLYSVLGMLSYSCTQFHFPLFSPPLLHVYQIYYVYTYYICNLLSFSYLCV